MGRHIEYEKAIGLRVKELREERGLTQEKLAEIAGIQQNQISRLENATYGATISTIISVAIALGYQPKSFFEVDFTLVLNSKFDTTRKINPNAEILQKLLSTDYFNIPRPVKMIAAECEIRYDYKLTSSAISGVMDKFVNKGLLKRIPAPQKNRFLYVK